MRKALTSTVAVLVLMSFSSTALAQSVTGIRSLNNEQRMSDYKLDEKILSDIYNDTVTNSDEVEKFYVDGERDIGNVILDVERESNIREGTGVILDSENFASIINPVEEQQLSWLISNNVVSRDKQIIVGNSGYSVTRQESLYDRGDPLSTMGGTEFLIGLYKSIYGVINSRPVIAKVPSVRSASKQIQVTYTGDDGKPYTSVEYESLKDQVVSGTGNIYKYAPEGSSDSVVRSFDEGDYTVIVSPNVAELYLKELVDKKVVPLESIVNLQFQSDYRDLGKVLNSSITENYPRWYPNLNPFMASSGAEQKSDIVGYTNKSKVWGDSFSILSDSSKEISDEKRGYASKQVELRSISESIQYLYNEKISGIEALRYAESLLRLTEKDMTDTEATLVTYKYGASYLNKLEDADRKTVMFLTAKGVLNFEDETEYNGLYSTLTKSAAYKLMYRIANKNARVNFDQIQLTDSDNFWIDKGFGQVEFKMNYLDAPSFAKYSNNSEDDYFSPLPDVETVSVREVAPTASIGDDSKESNFLGIKFFSRKNKLAALSDSPNKKFVIKKIFDNAEKYEYRGVRLTDEAAMKNQEWVTSIAVDSKTKEATIEFTVESASVYIALSAINSNLSVGTNFLFNTSLVTGVTKFDVDGKETTLVPASLFRDSAPEFSQKIMIISDKVLKNTETGATAILLQDNNIALVGTHVIHSKELMVKAVDGEVYYNLEIIRYLLSNMFISDIDPNSMYFTQRLDMPREVLANVIGSTGNSIGGTYVAKFLSPKSSDDLANVTKYETNNFVNISQLKGAGNFLIRNFEVLDENKQKMTYTVILQLTYSLPEKDANFLNPFYTKSNPTFNDINNFIYKKSEDSELADWWDNNYYLSNAIVNAFYQTKDVEYVNSGYLAPSITVLYNSPGVIKEKHLQSFLQEVGSRLPESWYNKFIGSSDYNLPVTTPIDTNNDKGKFYPSKQLSVGAYPKWVHAMYNNSSTTSAANGFTGEKQPNRSNTELWRHLMGIRTFSALQGVAYSGGSKLYMEGTTAYVETNGGAVFLKIDENDPKFPSKLVIDGKVANTPNSWTRGTKYEFKPVTRTPAASNDEWVGKTVRDSAGNEYTVSSVSGNTFSLIDTAEIKGKPTAVYRGKKVYYDLIGTITEKGKATSAPYQKAIETRHNQLFKRFTDIGISGYSKAATEFTKEYVVTGYDPKVASGKTVYVDLGGVAISKETTKTYLKVGSSKYSTFKETSTASAYTLISLDANLWAIDKSGLLFPRKTFPELQVGNVYYSGINQGLMDSIIYNSVGVVSVGKIKEGAKIIIGDLSFTKRGNSFISDPQANLNSWKDVLVDAENETKVKTAIYSTLAGLAVKISGNKTVDVSNIPVPLISFVTNPKLAVPTATSQTVNLLGGGETKNSAYVYKFKDGKSSSTPYNKKNPSAVTAVSFSVDIDNALVARQLDTVGNSFQLMLSTSSLSDGFLSDTPFFTESLSLKAEDDLTLMASKSNFKMVSGAEDIKNKMVQAYQEAMIGNLEMRIKLAFCAILSYLVVMSWIVYMMIRFHILTPILETLRDPSGNSTRTGIDFIRIISLGIFSLDSNPTFMKMFSGNVVLIFIIVSLLNTT